MLSTFVALVENVYAKTRYSEHRNLDFLSIYAGRGMVTLCCGDLYRDGSHGGVGITAVKVAMKAEAPVTFDSSASVGSISLPPVLVSENFFQQDPLINVAALSFATQPMRFRMRSS